MINKSAPKPELLKSEPYSHLPQIFENLQIDMPKATGPEGKELGSAKWKINGKFTISTQLNEKSKTME